MTKELSTTFKKIKLENIKGYDINSKQLFLQINLEDHAILISYTDKAKLLQDLLELKKCHITRNEAMSCSKANKLKQLSDENKINSECFFKFIFCICLFVIAAGSFTSFKFLLEPFKVYLSIGSMFGITTALLVSKKMMDNKWKKELKLAESKVSNNFNSFYHKNNLIIKDLETNIALINMEIKNDVKELTSITNQEDLLSSSIELRQFLDNVDSAPTMNDSIEEEKRKRLTL